MGKIKNHISNWLEEYGSDLGYDMSNFPDLGDLWWIAENNVDAETYYKDKLKGDKE